MYRYFGYVMWHKKAGQAIGLTFVFIVLSIQYATSQTFCTQPGTDQRDGYRYKLWNHNGQGKACMTIGEGALFSGEWEGIQNYSSLTSN